MSQSPLVIVSDVDGTLIDGDGLWPAPPRTLRTRLEGLSRLIGAPVVFALASSRTLSELLVLQRWLRYPGPCLAEDGAIVAVDDDRAGRARAAMAACGILRIEAGVVGRRAICMARLGASAESLRAALGELPDSNDTGLGDADLAQASVGRLRTLGFSTPSRQRRALGERSASLLLDPTAWTERDTGDIDIVRGGRWLTATRDAGKGAGVAWLRAFLDHDASVPCRMVGIGNGANDRSLLEACDVRFAVRDPGCALHPALQSVEDVIPLEPAGPLAWLEMLERLAEPGVLECV